MSERAIVLVDHGSRNAAANAQLGEAAARLRKRLADRRIVTAHMELAQPDVPTAIAECVAGGARHVTLALWFLSPGRHGTRDIPRLAEEARARHPGIEVVATDPLGVHEGLVDALLDRINESASRSRRG